MSDEWLWEEKPTSGAVDLDPLGVTLEYTLRGPYDYSSALIQASQLLPLAVPVAGKLAYRTNVRCDPEGNNHWDVTGSYSERQKQTNEYTFSFSTLGGMLRITHALEDIAQFPAGGPDFEGAIDVQRDGEVRGVEIVLPATKFTYDFRFPSGAVNEATAIAWGEMAGRTNSKLWHNIQPGEGLILSANGRDGTNSEATISFELAYSKNLVNIDIGAITGVSKKGWEIAWTEFEDAVDGGRPVVRPKRIHVQRVYQELDFFEAFGF